MALTDDSAVTPVSLFDRPSRVYQTAHFTSDITLHLRWCLAGFCYKVRSF